MPPARMLPTLALAAALALAGCLSSATEEPLAPGATTPGEAPPGTPLPPGASGALLFSSREPFVETVETEGKFQVQNHGFPAGFPQRLAGRDPGNRHVIDITEKVPMGIPVRLVAEVSAELPRGDLDLWFNVAQADIWTARFDTPYGGKSLVEYVIVRTAPDPIEVVVQYDEVDTSPEFTYQLRVTVSHDPALLPAGIAVGVPLAAGETLKITLPAPGETPALWLWDADDAFVGRFPIEGGAFSYSVPQESAVGDWVVFLSARGGDAKIETARAAGTAETAATPTVVRAMKQLVVEGQGVNAAAGESEFAWTFDVPRVPLGVGIELWGAAVTKDIEFSLASPAGPLMSASFQSDPWIYPGFFFFSGMGAENLAAGAYTASVKFGASAGPEPIGGREFLAYYER